jgi:hypothetical protein
MMKNKVIVKAVFPSIDKVYDIKIPVNELIWKVSSLVTKAVYDMNGIPYDINNDNFAIINKETGLIYESNSIVIDTDIRNGSELFFIKEK